MNCIILLSFMLLVTTMKNVEGSPNVKTPMLNWQGVANAQNGECIPLPVNNDHCNCGTEVYPICGSDGRTYLNKCILCCNQGQHPNLKMVHDGKCDACHCLMISEPVCGSNGLTYFNECIFRCDQSKMQYLEIAHQGKCPN